MDPAPGAPGAPDHAPRHLRLVPTLLLVALALGAGVAGFAALARQRKEPARSPTAVPRTAVRAPAVARATHRETLTGYGRARPLRRARVAAELAATVLRVAPELEAGTRVASGTALVWLDDRDARAAAAGATARVAAARAALERAEADAAAVTEQHAAASGELAAARRELARVRGLVPQAASASEVDAQQMVVSVREQTTLALAGRLRTTAADVAARAADVRAAEAAEAAAALDVERSVVRAPWDGVIVSRAAQPGERVTPGAVLFDLVDPARVEVAVALPAARFGDVAAGAAASVRLHEDGAAVWSGSVARVAPAVDAERSTFDVFLEIEARAADSGAPVPPGAFVVAEVAGRTTADVFAVPREALVGDRLFVVELGAALADGGGRHEAVVHERRPHVARRLPDVVLVDSGLEPGERVVVTAVDRVAEGTHVIVLADAEGDAPADGTPR